MDTLTLDQTKFYADRMVDGITVSFQNRCLDGMIDGSDKIRRRGLVRVGEPITVQNEKGMQYLSVSEKQIPEDAVAYSHSFPGIVRDGKKLSLRLTFYRER